MSVPSSKPIYARTLSGTVPGLFDPSQSERLHHVPGSTITFASFHPLSASSQFDIGNIRNLSLNEELYRPKRIVIETFPGRDGGSFWRFVPRARRDPGVENEGSWPRVIDLCGELVLCHQDQWDIYKLDPEYDCFVPIPPQRTVISRKKGKEKAHTEGSSRPLPNTKRHPPTPSSEEGKPRKKPRPTVTISDSSEDEREPFPVVSSSDDEEDEVEELVAGKNSRDTAPFHTKVHSSRSGPGWRPGRPREHRWKQNSTAPTARTKATDLGSVQDQEMVDLTMIDDEPHRREQAMPSASSSKRKVSQEAGFSTGSSQKHSPSRTPDHMPEQATKRARTRSPGADRRENGGKRAARGKKRIVRLRERATRWNGAWHDSFWTSVMADVPPAFCGLGHSDDKDASTSKESSQEAHWAEANTEMDEEFQRWAAIEESRRKLAELEKDKPLWEEAARKRRAAEVAEERANRAKREAEHRAAEAERLRKEQEAARAEAERKAKEKAQKEQSRRRNQQQHRWAYGPWTTQRALERYKSLCETFDNAKFTTDEPVSFDFIPWPVLRSPAILTVEDIDWAAVETFFNTVKIHMRGQDYKLFVEKSHKRFHPDRWRARGILRSIEDDEVRNCLEVAANTVAQAITPLWREVKSG
ncbi:uncharacterized protein FIBRA_03522 [Fibroporia radiculosa]|uniref:Uncharacterized protein n=1 Tax=Fibroporia radiculosa TaxID=599839 RepID=J4G5R6_9APHY|nr:uncharacterized protein FIBRA_03522 [Fibroporia radiculosa]CCM01468.1 predicted protein [Fibroporia radiculosa]